MITATQQYNGSVIWTPDDNSFREGQQYTATITLIPKAGYTLEGIHQNFFTVPGAIATNQPDQGS
jgi:hypothetical protein